MLGDDVGSSDGSLLGVCVGVNEIGILGCIDGIDVGSLVGF